MIRNSVSQILRGLKLPRVKRRIEEEKIHRKMLLQMNPLKVMGRSESSCGCIFFPQPLCE
jgi:hypothetical protein